MGAVEEEKPAPTFTLPGDTGETVSLESLRGRPVVLYLYPEDDTPGAIC
jgi:thioredoxin-dependent peroxiredoxin